MAKKLDPVKPLFPLKHEFYASLNKFASEAGLLAQTVEQLLQMPEIIANNGVRQLLQERVDAFRNAQFGADA